MQVLVIATVLILLWSGSFQSAPISEKRAVASAQKIPASNLDAELPPLPFADWLGQLVGPQAGVNWQLNECGEQPSLLVAEGREPPACAEVDALLPDGRKVVVMIKVGTFEKGIIGNPSFSHAAIEHEGELYPVRRLRDLAEGLREPAALRDKYSIKLVARNANSLSAPGENGATARPGAGSEDAAPPPPAPQPPPPQPASPQPAAPQPAAAQLAATEPAVTSPATEVAAPATRPAAEQNPLPQEPRKVSEGVVRGNAIVKAQPVYPANAKKMQAAGSVEVQVTISEEGRVIGATSVNGHPLLRRAAIDAARKWVFKPTMLNGIPVKVQSTLTFVFAFTQ